MENCEMIIDSKSNTYVRNGGEIQKKTETKISELYKQKNSILFPSGINSIFVILTALKSELSNSKRNVILHSNELFGGTKITINYFKDSGIKFVGFDMNQGDENFEKCLKENQVKFNLFNYMKNLTKKKIKTGQYWLYFFRVLLQSMGLYDRLGENKKYEQRNKNSC